MNGLYAFIAAAIVYHRHRERRLQTVKNRFFIGRRSDEINIMRALADESLINASQLKRRYGKAVAVLRNARILTKTTAQITARKKYRSRTACTADTRFFPIMQGGAGGKRFRRTVTIPRQLFSGKRCRAAGDPAVTGTIVTNIWHEDTPFRIIIV